MPKIQSLESMEKVFLDASSVDDIGIDRTVPQDPNKKLTADQVRHDVAVLGRILIRAYVGWPVHDDIVKRRVLKELLNVYNNAYDMTAGELFELLKPVLAKVPDNHVRFIFAGQHLTTSLCKKGKKVGSNTVKQGEDVTTMLRPDNVAVVSMRSMRNDDVTKNKLLSFESDIRKSDALIVDLRGNGGGNSKYSDMFANALCGVDNMPSALRVSRRSTDDAKKLMSGSHIRIPAENGDMVIVREDLLIPQWNPERGYTKPIYILTDRGVMSSAEMFIARMRHHPMVKLVGENTRGGEVYGNCVNGYAPNSNIRLMVGMDYREMEQANFETNGFTPDIPVTDGADAMDVALADFEKHKLEKQIINDTVAGKVK